MQKLALTVLAGMMVSGCAATRDFSYGAPASPRPVVAKEGYREDIDAQNNVLFFGILGGVVAGGVTCAVDCDKPANVLVPAAIGTGLAIGAIYLLLDDPKERVAERPAPARAPEPEPEPEPAPAPVEDEAP